VADPGLDGVGEEGSLLLEQRFAIVPEWVIDADISDCAYRLYSVLLRYGQTSGCRMPGRATLADRLHKTSKDTVDRALKELVAVGAVVVEHRHRDGRHLTNRYHLMSTRPAARRIDPAPGGRIPAATPGRTDAATLAANLGPNQEFFTEEPPPPRTAGGTAAAAARWSAPRLLEVLRQAVAVRGWPATLAAAALRTLAADPAGHTGWGCTPPHSSLEYTPSRTGIFVEGWVSGAAGSRSAAAISAVEIPVVRTW
jgi:hypothetical protein